MGRDLLELSCPPCALTLKPSWVSAGLSTSPTCKHWFCQRSKRSIAALGSSGRVNGKQRSRTHSRQEACEVLLRCLVTEQRLGGTMSILDTGLSLAATPKVACGRCCSFFLATWKLVNKAGSEKGDSVSPHHMETLHSGWR